MIIVIEKSLVPRFDTF